MKKLSKAARIRAKLFRVLKEWQEQDLFRFLILQTDGIHDEVINYTWRKDADKDEWTHLYSAVMGLSWTWKGISFIEVTPDHIEIVLD